MLGGIHDIIAQPWVRVVVVLVAALIIAIVVFNVARFAARRVLRPDELLAIVLAGCERPVEAAILLLAIEFALLDARLGLGHGIWLDAARHGVTVALLAALTWLAIRVVSGIQRAIEKRHPANVADNLQARRIQTQTRVLARSIMILIGVLGVAIILMTFPDVRALGASILASAGVAGLVVGLAAKPVLGNLLAGLQIALAQPIRLDDVVVIQGHWGRVEEINQTYVVVKIWNERRLVIPLQWLIENPFENWTRTSSQIMGIVYLWVDYRLPLAPLRAEFERVVRAAPEWDQRVMVLQVTDANERAMQLRMLVTSRDSGINWNLQVRVREALVDFLQREYPQYLPHLRVESHPGDEPAAARSTAFPA